MGHLNTAEYLLNGARDEAICFIDEDRSFSYAELRDAVAGASARLRALDLRPGAAVGLVASNSFFWIAAYLATMHSGQVAVPLATVLSGHEVGARLDWVKAQAVFLDAPGVRRFGNVVPAGVHTLSEDALAGQGARTEAADVTAHADAAYLFTSGTTRDPRVVRITHANIQANTDSILGFLPIDESDRMLVVLPFTYVFGASVLHTHLRVGATLINQRSVAYPETTAAMLEDHRCTGFAGVPSIFQTLMRSSSFPRRNLPHLLTIQQAGGALPPAVLREIVATHPQAKLYVMYGQTEATARLSYLSPDALFERPSSIGKAIPGVTLRVLRADGVPVRPGEIGEIHAYGANVSPGYLHDDALTALKMPDGDLHTGDLGTIDEDGYIYVADRVEDFIKSWGFRIPSQDIEASLMELPELVAAAVVGLPDEQTGERVEAAVVARPRSSITADEVLAHCRASLPKYMVPRKVHFVQSLPFNANGKVIKRDVRAMIGRLSCPPDQPTDS